MAITYDDIKKVNKGIKTIQIHGKDYAEVASKIDAFRKLYPEGFITTNVISHENGMIIMGATCGFYNEDGSMHILGTGTAYEKENSNQINKASYVENCETSAVGRCLSMANIGNDVSIASADEVANAIYQQNNPTPEPTPEPVQSCKCAVCGGIETDALLIKASMDKWGKCVCKKCIDKKRKEMAAKKQAKAAPVADPEPVPPPMPEDAQLPFPLD